MKRFLTLLAFGVLLVSTETMAQNWLNRMANDYRQRNQQRTTQRYNRQQTYQNRQRYGQQERANRQRVETQEREYLRQQSTGNYTGSNFAASSNSQVSNTSQGNEKVVALVVNGSGITKEEATRNALRSAIEQAFGTFVSANTNVLNDELIKDEITTVSTGNVKSYKELSVNQNNGMFDVSVQAVVSIDQLTKFAQSKGMQAELAGASFAMNMKMRELNKKNEVVAIDHMIEKAKAIAQKGLFDYKLEIGEPKLVGNSKFAVKLTILFCENENTKAFYDNIYKTLQAFSLSQKERQEYRNAGLKYYNYNDQLENIHYGSYALRNQYPVYRRYGGEITRLLPIIVDNALNYVIRDNLGNQITCVRKKVEQTTSDPLQNFIVLQNYIAQGNRTCEWYYIDKENQILRFYELRPKERIALVDHGYDKLPAIPLMDFIGIVGGNYLGISTEVSFNPIAKNKGKSTRGNNPQRIYFCQEFFIVYSEEELSKINSITIGHRKE